MDLLDLGSRLVRLGESLGADEVEIYILTTQGQSLALVDQVESVSSGISTGLGVRLVSAKRVGLYSTTILNRREAERAVRRACSIARVSEPNKEWVSLPLRFGTSPIEGTFDRETAELRPEALSTKAREMLHAVHVYSPNLSVTRGMVSVSTEKTTIVNSHGCGLEQEGSFALAYVSVKAEKDGKKGLSTESDQSHAWNNLEFLGMCQKASDDALKAVEAKPIPAGEMPVIWRNKLFATVLSIMFGGTLSAESVQKKRSPWAGKVGTQITADNINLTDDGLLPRGIGTRMFDDEGVPQQRTPLIESGVLKGFLYDTFTANKDHVESTGNASRSYGDAPVPTPTNLIFALGVESFDKIVKETRRGLYLTEVIGVWLSNAISGDLSATATNAFLVEDGVLTQPVKGVLVSGNFFEIIRSKIDLIGCDVDHTGDAYSPTVRIASMTLTPV